MHLRSALLVSLAALGLVAACGGSTEDDGGVGQNGAGGSGTAGSTSTGGASTAGMSTGGTTPTGGTTAAGQGGTGSSGKAGSTGGAGKSAACNPTNCKGCCDASEACRPGDQAAACGVGGVLCTACDTLGFACKAGKCQGEKPPCDASTCSGCCDALGNCQKGTEINACGVTGAACSDCAKNGEGCNAAGACEGPPPPCSPKTCGGCCDAAGVCQTGTDAKACGSGGAACDACQGGNPTCVKPGNYCGYFPPCSEQTCPGCCDDKGLCRSGKTDTVCGQKGGTCFDCAATGEACATQGFCYEGPHCGPDNCGGCCTAAGECKGGSEATACGQYGGLCKNCGADTCEAFACKTADTCPSTYAGCSPKAETTPPKLAAACDAGTLDDLGVACKGMNPGPQCGQFFAKLQKNDPTCFDCVAQFAGEDSFVRCISPFLGEGCNHLASCAIDCGTTCDGCDEGSKEACNNVQFSPGGACGPYLYGYYCLNAALQGPGSFCSFEGAGNDVGNWIKTVAGHYCGK